MAGFSPQGVAVTSGGVRRKIRSPYIDMIRGQYGQATQNVLAQKQEDQQQAETQATQKYRAGTLAEQKRQNQMQEQYNNQQLQLARQNQKFQKEQAKQAGLMSAIGTGINAVGTGANLYNTMGGWQGIKKVGSDLFGGLKSGLGMLGLKF
jgi:hypothetical protein